MDVESYLARIGYRGSTEPTARSLRALHEAHLYRVPFENLDIHRKRSIVLDESRLLNKVIFERRGGFCYELNGAFAWLLRQLGFKVTLLSARVAKDAGGFGPEFDHLLLRVDLETPFLADVGFGDGFLHPLRLQAEPQRDGSRLFRIDSEENNFILLRSDDDGERWSPQYRFSLEPRALQNFAAMCDYHQTSPNSHFTQKTVVTRATPEGRLTLREDRLIISAGGTKTERPITGPEAYRAALNEHFEITSSTSLEIFIDAPPAAVYRALLDPIAIATWMVPDGMRGDVHRYEPREQGRFRVSLTYDAPDGTGKTTPERDTYHGRFLKLVSEKQVVQAVEFETSAPGMDGEMTIIFTLTEENGGTRLSAVHRNLPPALSRADNEIGWKMSLGKLKTLVEAQGHSTTAGQAPFGSRG